MKDPAVFFRWMLLTPLATPLLIHYLGEKYDLTFGEYFPIGVIIGVATYLIWAGLTLHVSSRYSWPRFRR